MSIEYVQGDATAPRGVGPKIIVHVCNDVGGWGRGFVLALSKRWGAPEAHFRAWHAGETPGTPLFELGAVQLVEVAPDLFVANLVGQRGTRSKGGVPPIRHDAILAGLRVVAAHAEHRGASVHMPRIGCGLAGGRWADVEALVAEALVDHQVTVYDFE